MYRIVARSFIEIIIVDIFKMHACMCWLGTNQFEILTSSRHEQPATAAVLRHLSAPKRNAACVFCQLLTTTSAELLATNRHAQKEVRTP